MGTFLVLAAWIGPIAADYTKRALLATLGEIGAQSVSICAHQNGRRINPVRTSPSGNRLPRGSADGTLVALHEAVVQAAPARSPCLIFSSHTILEGP
jgi:hypothetical protein